MSGNKRPCKRCKKEKHRDEFAERYTSGNRDIRQTTCIECEKWEDEQVRLNKGIMKEMTPSDYLSQEYLTGKL